MPTMTKSPKKKKKEAKKTEAPATWAELLRDALNDPGRAAECYRAFHNYSIGNQYLAASQMQWRGIPITPIATFKAWKAKGRSVRKGEKAIILCVPIVVQGEDKETGDKFRFVRGFTYRARWFALAQTDGTDAELDEVPGWSWDGALNAFGVKLVPFEGYVNGNVQGWANSENKTVALSPVAAHASRTMLHELAHAILHNVDDEEGRTLSTAVKELEAEAVAYLVSATLELPGAEESRGYMQHWYGKGKTVPEAQATRIFAAAGKILEAGKMKEDK